MKILIVEDDLSLSKSITSFLKDEGYVVESAMNCNQADLKISLYDYDCILVDLTLPDGNGFELIKEIKLDKEKVSTGIIIISAKNTLNDRIKGLDFGADDYLTKPFHLSELNSRIKALVRRRKFEGSNEVSFHEITLFPDAKEVRVNNKIVNLTKKEFQLLFFMIGNKNRVLTKESIAEHLLGDDSDLIDSFDFVYSHFKNLRKKLLAHGGSDYIKTIYGLGYKFTSE